MSVSSVNSSNPYSYLQQLQQDGVDASSNGAPSDPLEQLFQSFTGGGSSDPLLGAMGQDAGQGDGSTSPIAQLSSQVMQALFSIQGDQPGQSAPGGSPLSSLMSKFDANGDGQISQSEFETAIGSNADQSKVDELFSKIDGNGDGQISAGEMQSAMQKAHGGGHGHHHAHAAAGGSGAQGSDPLQSLLSGTSADGTSSQSSTNADGSTTTTITYADGTKVEMTVPGASNDSDSNPAKTSNPNAPTLANMLKQLISLQAQLSEPTTNVSV